MAHRGQAQRIGHLHHRIDTGRDEARLYPRPADAFHARATAAGQAAPVLLTGHGGFVAIEEHRHFRVRTEDAGVMPAIADIAPQRRCGTAGAGAAHDPFRNRAGLFGHLLEDGLRDVVVGTPVGGALGIGELVHEVAAGFTGQLFRITVEVAGTFDQVATAAVELDRGDLFRRGGGRDHRNERQAEQPREIGFGHGGRAAGGLDHRTPFTQPAIGQRIQEQRARQPVLQAAGGMARLILQVQVDALEPWQRQRDQVGIGGTVEISFDLADGGSHPFTLRHGGQSLSGRNGAIRPLYVAVPSGAGR